MKQLTFLTILLLAYPGYTMINHQTTQHLPDYVAVNDQSIPELLRLYLRVPCQEVSFPLSPEDKEILTILEEKHDEVKANVTGLAAPQIGFNKRMIVFKVLDDPDVKKMRDDFKETMTKAIWINPTYRPLSDELIDDYDLCLSVKDIVGRVKRFAKIAYTAYTPEGVLIEGQATGFLARIIQHEIDHINGILFIDKAEKNSLIPRQEYFQSNQKCH